MPTLTTVDAAWTPSPQTFDDAEARRFDTAIFLGDGTNNGVRGGIVYHGPTSLGVTVNGSDQITVQAGVCAIPAATGLGVYRAALSAATAATGILARNATNPRIDLIVFQATSTGATLKTIDGTPGASPSAPALPAQHIELARITVPAVGGGAVTVDSTFRTFTTGLGGLLPVATAARLPGSGNLHGQQAVTLDTNTPYEWNAVAASWDIQNTAYSTAVTYGTGCAVGSTNGAAVLRRNGWVEVAAEFLTSAVISAGQTVFTIPAGYRPVTRRVFFMGMAVNTPVLFAVNTDGTVVAQNIITSGVAVYGTGTYPVA